MAAERAVCAVDGYLYLGLPDEALDEVNGLDPGEQTEAPVMCAQVRALLHARRWREAEELSELGAAIHPLENQFVVQRAFALHQLKKGGEAVRVLLDAPDWIRRTGILHYNLACYEAKLGDIGTARQCIDAACQLNAAFTKNARHDPDLERLWN